MAIPGSGDKLQEEMRLTSQLLSSGFHLTGGSLTGYVSAELTVLYVQSLPRH